MFKPTLRRNIILSLGCTIAIVLVVNTYFQVRNLRTFARETVAIRSEALSAGILNNAEALRRYNPAFAENTAALLSKLSVQCEQLYELNREKNVTHFAVLDPEGTYAAHSDKELTGQNAPARVFAGLKQQKLFTIISDGVYHTLVPIMDGEKFIGAVDVGIPESYTAAVSNRMISNSLFLLVLFLAVSLSVGAYLTRITIKKPIDGLLSLGRELAAGRVVETGGSGSKFEEIAALEEVFTEISRYFQSVAEVATQVSGGVLDSRIELRSEGDVLGKAMSGMLEYLNQVASVAEKVAEGDLTGSIQRRSDRDSFGQAIESMKAGLNSLIVTIRSSSQGIIDSGGEISSLSGQGKSIVQEVNAAAEEMMGTMHEMGESIGSVAGNMENLSSSVGETSASMDQMTSSISHISTNAENLSREANRTIEALAETVGSLEEAVQSIDVSTRLSKEATEASGEGKQAVGGVMAGMNTLLQSVTAAADTMEKFEVRSHEIDKILHVIQEIADSTSLLALNAAIIAAQAGEKGKGFSVVAEEIKSLANEVKDSVQDIGGIIQGLQEDIAATAESVRLGSDQARENMERTTKANEALERISQNAEHLSREVVGIAKTLHMTGNTSHAVTEAMKKFKTMSDDIMSATSQQQMATSEVMTTMKHLDGMSKQIALAMDEQASGVRQMVNSTKDVAKLMENNMSSSESSVQSSERLMAQADSLIKAVRRFRLDGGIEVGAGAEKPRAGEET